MSRPPGPQITRLALYFSIRSGSIGGTSAAELPGTPALRTITDKSGNAACKSASNLAGYVAPWAPASVPAV